MTPDNSLVAALPLQAREEVFRLRVRQLASVVDDNCQVVALDQFIAFGLACVSETPVPGGCPPANLLRTGGALRDGLVLVECWLNGDPVAANLRALLARSYKEADEAGAFAERLEGLTGQRAASLAAFLLHLGTALAAQADTAGKPAVVLEAIRRAAFLARHAAEEGLTAPALEFQERVFEQHFSAVAATVPGS
jgi:hypothetical protein